MSNPIYLVVVLSVLLYLVVKLEGMAIKSSLDDRFYDVVPYFKYRTRAADLLAAVNLFNATLIKGLVARHRNTENQWIKDIVESLEAFYRQDSLTENHPTDGHNVSYVFERGMIFCLCLRRLPQHEDRFIDLETLKFVSMHELAHIGAANRGHDKNFWLTFKFLLKTAHAMKLHVPVDYSKKPVNYCSLTIRKNPFF